MRVATMRQCDTQGMDMSKVEFLSASEEINKNPGEYWTLVMDVARKNNLKRIVRCSQIMGRNDSDDLSAAQIFYPCMQCAVRFCQWCPRLWWSWMRFLAVDHAGSVGRPTVLLLLLPHLPLPPCMTPRRLDPRLLRRSPSFLRISSISRRTFASWEWISAR
jgi:hypothetical protein